MRRFVWLCFRFAWLSYTFPLLRAAQSTFALRNPLMCFYVLLRKTGEEERKRPSSSFLPARDTFLLNRQRRIRMITCNNKATITNVMNFYKFENENDNVLICWKNSRNVKAISCSRFYPSSPRAPFADRIKLSLGDTVGWYLWFYARHISREVPRRSGWAMVLRILGIHGLIRSQLSCAMERQVWLPRNGSQTSSAKIASYHHGTRIDLHSTNLLRHRLVLFPTPDILLRQKFTASSGISWDS